MEKFDVSFPNLGIEFKGLSNVAVSPFGFDIYWYGFFVAAAVFVGVLTAYLLAKRTGQNTDNYMNYAFIAIISCVAGARLYYVVFDWSRYRGNPLEILDFRGGGLAIYGAVLAAILSAFLYTKVKKLDFLLFSDTGICGMVIGQAIGRWGNFFNREVYGTATESLFAMQYTSSVPVHPLFLYESVWNLALFAFMMIFWKRKAFNGEIFFIYMVGYGIGRFWMEGLRDSGYVLTLFGTDLAVSQALSAVLAVVGIAAIIYFRVKKPRVK